MSQRIQTQMSPKKAKLTDKKSTTPELKLAVARPSLIQQAANRLREAIESNRWSDALPSERKLSEQLQVSRPTLRSALKILVSEGLIKNNPRRKNIILCNSRPTASKRSGKLVMLSPFTPDELYHRIPFVLQWLDGLRASLARKGLILEFAVQSSCYRKNSIRSLSRFIKYNEAECWLLLRSTKEMQEWFNANLIRHVVIGTPFIEARGPSIDFDQAATCQHAVAQMARLGHRRIAYLSEMPVLAGDIFSRKAFELACSDHSKAINSVLMEHDGTREGVIKRLDQLLRLKQRPTAIFSVGTQQTLTVFTRLLQLGFTIPHDIAIISRDDHATLDFITPSLTRYQRNQETFAKRLFRLIQTVMEHAAEDFHSDVKLHPDFFLGESLSTTRTQINPFSSTHGQQEQ